MLNTRIAVMRSISTPLIQSEKLVDAAIGELTTLVAAAVTGRATARLPLNAGELALEQVTVALQQLMATRKALAAAHADFADVKDRMGLARVPASEDSDYGDTGNTPREFMQDEQHLKVVRAA